MSKPTQLIVVWVAACLLLCGGCLTLLFTGKKAPEPIKCSPAQRAEQQANIAELIRTGVILRCDDRYLYVNPVWHSFNIDAKRQLAAGVWCFANEVPTVRAGQDSRIESHRLLIMDAETGKQLATFSALSGLSID
jgi:hypothetical protein